MIHVGYGQRAGHEAQPHVDRRVPGRHRRQTLAPLVGRRPAPADALFVFIGAVPRTDWLAGTVKLDDHGFVATGQDGAEWLETSMAGVYAAGDIRAGSIKRVAAAVGEGSTASMLAHESLTRR